MEENTKELKITKCALNNINTQDHYTCFSKKELISIINAYNETNEDSKDFTLCSKKVCIHKGFIKVNDTDTTKDLWYKIYDTLKPICKDESCWIDLDFIKKISHKDLRDKLRYYTFKPKFYYRQDNWLTTTDINDIMKQIVYKYKYKNFYYIGTEPCDFYKITSKVFSNKKMYTSKMVGIIFNLDTHDKPGSHWTSMLIDNDTRTFYYFDSVGNEPNKHIKEFIKKYIKNYLQYNTKNQSNDDLFTVYINKKVHQKGNSECGIYSIYFIMNKLKDTTQPINNKRITDKNMKDFRKYLFAIN